MTPPPTPRRPTIELQRLVWDEHGRACVYCGADANHLDHLVPWSRGGPTIADNLRPACPTCGTRKDDSDPVEWMGATCPLPLLQATAAVRRLMLAEGNHGRPRPRRATPEAHSRRGRPTRRAPRPAKPR